MVIKDLLDCKEYVYPRDADLSRRRQLKYNSILGNMQGILKENNQQELADNLSTLVWRLDNLAYAFDMVEEKLQNGFQMFQEWDKTPDITAGKIADLQAKTEEMYGMSHNIRVEILDLAKDVWLSDSPIDVTALDAKIMGLGIENDLNLIQTGVLESLDGMKDFISYIEQRGNPDKKIQGRSEITLDDRMVFPIRMAHNILSTGSNIVRSALRATKDIEQSILAVQAVPDKQKPSIRQALAAKTAEAHAQSVISDKAKKVPEVAL